MKNFKTLKVGIIGAGLIGFKRARAILELKQDAVAAVYDINKSRMGELAQLTGAKTHASWQALVKDPSLDIIIVATYHKILPRITLAVLKAGKHALAEKPLGNNANEASEIYRLAEKKKRVLKVGFNHRFHPAAQKAYELFKKGAIGKILYVRSVYGHGGRPNYDLEWRIQKKYTRGGEMYDQGSHILDMAYWFLGRFEKVFATTRNYFWKKTPLEDNGFCQLLTKEGQMVQFQVSLTQWKNRFTFEIYGNKGYLLMNGLGRSYGMETLTLGQDVGMGKVPKEQVWTFEDKDISWALEWKELRRAIISKKPVMSSAKENVFVMKTMDVLFKSAKSGKLETVK